MKLFRFRDRSRGSRTLDLLTSNQYFFAVKPWLWKTWSPLFGTWFLLDHLLSRHDSGLLRSGLVPPSVQHWHPCERYVLVPVSSCGTSSSRIVFVCFPALRVPSNYVWVYSWLGISYGRLVGWLDSLLVPMRLGHNVKLLRFRRGARIMGLSLSGVCHIPVFGWLSLTATTSIHFFYVLQYYTPWFYMYLLYFYCCWCQT